jgi:RNA ligase (TIGR02306 family)
MRKLATIKTIDKLEPIENADKIELATIGGWKVVVAKDVGHQEGNKVVYCEIDSFLPIEPEFEFLRKSSYKKLIDGTEGFRLKTIRLRNQISQGLIIPLEDAVNVMKRKNGEVYYEMLELNKDVSDLLGITKYEPPIPANLSGTVKGNFPSFIQKTDEERIQNLTKEYEQWKSEDHNFYVTEKLDGSSATFYIKDGEFGVCSRNLDLKETEDNTYWKVARELNIEERLRGLNRNISIQGELIGEGIQKNPYKIKGHTVRFFNVFDIDKFERVGYGEFNDIIVEKLELQTVPILVVPGFELPETISDLLKLSEKKSAMNDKTEREGIVIRSYDNTISFKVISNKFLLNGER